MSRLLTFILILLCSCMGSKKYPDEDKEFSMVPPQLHLPAEENKNPAELIQYWKNKNCIRGIPSGILNGYNPNFLHKQFQLGYDAGIETARLVNGDSLMIINSGCDYYQLEMRLFSTKSETYNPLSTTWVKKTTDLFMAMQDSRVPFRFEEIANKISQESSKHMLQKGKAVLIEENNKLSKTWWVLENTGRLPDNTSFILMKIYVGPL